MSTTHLFPFASSVIILVFAALVLRRYVVRRGPHLLMWGVGLLMFGTAAMAEAYAAAAWHPLAFQLWYLAGAVLSAAWIGQGSVNMLAGTRLPNLLISMILGFAAAAALSLTIGRLGLSAGAIAALIAFLGVIFASVFWRRLVRRWNPARLATLLNWVLIAGSLAAAYLVFSLPLDAARFTAAEPLSSQYREILPAGAGVRKLTPFFNIYGTLALAGGALYSAWLLWRKAIMPHRVVGNVLIAVGALLIASASTMVRLGLADYHYLGQFLSAVFMFSGFLLASIRAPMRSGAEAVKA